MSQSKPAPRRRGVTLIECLVVITVLGLLAALLLPALQGARESARRSHCANNLHQMGIGLANYVSTFESFPSGSGQLQALHVAILPYVEMQPLYNAIRDQASSGGAGDGTSVSMDNPSDTAVTSTAVSLFLCPSDSPRGGLGNRFAWTNYAGSRGVGVQKFGYNGMFTTPFESPVRPSSVTDGMSATALMAEWLLGTIDETTRDPRRTNYHTPVPYVKPDELDVFARACHDIDILTARIAPHSKGSQWAYGEFAHTLYNHTLIINDHTCLNGSSFQEGAWTAGSQHPGGANTLFADGHVQFLKESTALSVWRALGSRNGRETLSSDAY